MVGIVSPPLIRKHSSSDTSQIVALGLFAQLINRRTSWEWKIKLPVVSFHSGLGSNRRSNQIGAVLLS